MEHDIEHFSAGVAISKVAPKRKRASCEDQDIPWTVSRCNRLLRTITSRISILQKLASSNRLPAQSSNTAPSAPAALRRLPSKESGPRQTERIGASPSKDPEWLPRADQMAHPEAKTYAGRARSKQSRELCKQRPTDPGRHSIGLATPFVKRMLRPSSTTKHLDDDSSSLPYLHLKSEVGKKRRKLAIKPNSLAEETYTNLISALESFLMATKPEVPERRTGASSLMSACLRKVPAYIEYEDDANAQEDDEGDDSRDARNEIYQELEDLGTGTQGWSGLREVVRAHGLQKIGAAMGDGLLPPLVVDALINVCGKCDAVAEGQTLLQSRLISAKKNEQISALEQISGFAELYRCDAFYMRVLRMLLKQRSISLSWLCTRQEIWSRILRSMMHPGEMAEAIALLRDFLQAALEREWSEPEVAHQVDKQVQETLEQMSALLTAIACTQNTMDTRKSSVPGSITRNLQDIFATGYLALAGSCGEQTDVSRQQVRLGLIAPLLTSSLVLRLRDAQAPPEIVQPSIDETLELVLRAQHPGEPVKNSRSGRTLGDNFVSRVAMCMRRWDEAAADDLVREVCTDMLRLATSADATLSKFLKGMASNNAEAYAGSLNDKASILIAEDIEDVLLQGISPLKARTRKIKPLVDDYRWEDGLCEWIMKTPMVLDVNRKGPSTIPSYHAAQSAQQNGRTCADEERPIFKPKLSRLIPATHQKARKVLSEIRNTPAADARTVSDEVAPPKAAIKRSHAQQHEAAPEAHSEDDLDELAFSARKRKGSAEPKMSKKTIGGSGMHGKRLKTFSGSSSSLYRQSSGSSAWETTQLSDDELGI